MHRSCRRPRPSRARRAVLCLLVACVGSIGLPRVSASQHDTMRARRVVQFDTSAVRRFRYRRMPSVTGLDTASAARLLDSAGLRRHRVIVPGGDSIAVDMVSTQWPPADSTVLVTQVVVLTLRAEVPGASGVPNVTAPDTSRALDTTPGVRTRDSMRSRRPDRAQLADTGPPVTIKHDKKPAWILAVTLVLVVGFTAAKLLLPPPTITTVVRVRPEAIRPLPDEGTDMHVALGMRGRLLESPPAGGRIPESDEMVEVL